MPVGHFVKKRAAIFLGQEFQEFSLPVRYAFFFLHHLIKIAIQAGTAFVGKRPLNATIAKGTGHRPADSTPAFTGINPIKRFVGGSRTDTIVGSVLPAFFPPAHHHFPAV
jgi:hypothetical protein